MVSSSSIETPAEFPTLKYNPYSYETREENAYKKPENSKRYIEFLQLAIPTIITSLVTRT